MEKFDVFKIEKAPFPLAVNVQSDLLHEVKTRVVIPLRDAKNYKNEEVSRLKPIIIVDGAPYILSTPELTAIKPNLMGDLITNIETEYRYDITNAIDFLFNGF